MTALLRLLLVTSLFWAVGCRRPSVRGELVLDGGEDHVRHKMEPELRQVGTDQITILTSDAFWHARVEPLLTGEPPGIRAFLQSPATSFSISLQNQEHDQAGRLVSTFALEFRNLTRAEAETVLHAVSVGFDAEARERATRKRHELLSYFQNEMESRQNQFDRRNSSPAEAERENAVRAKLEQAISFLANEEPTRPVRSAKIR